MASASGIGIPTFQPPQFNEAGGVLGKIEGQVGNINQLFVEVQQLLAEMQDLQAQRPKADDFKNNKGQIDQTAFSEAMQQFQMQVTVLNRKIEGVYRKIGQAQAMLQRTQTQELPAAERRDAENVQRSLEQASETLRQAAEAITGNDAEEDAGAVEEEAHIELRLIERNIDIRLTSDPSFKDVIAAFSLMSTIVGDPTAAARGANPTVAMPSTPGSGLPPVGTP